MKTKHTTGQWIIEKENKNYAILSNRMYIGNISSSDVGSEQSQANAKLIASAPELLEALQLLLKSHRQLTFEKNHSLNDNWLEEKAHEAILKATK
jgi:hypothetical protein